jgi:ABC-2 type transport system permease protein
MQHIKLLLKKDTIENVSSLKIKKDILGILTSLLLVVIIYGVFIYVFNNFAKLYVETDFGNVLEQATRVKELLTISFGAVFIVNVIVGVKKMYTVLTKGKEDDILIYQPINTGVVFIYKLLKVYISQVISTILITLPMVIAIDGLSATTGGFLYYMLIAIIVILLPLISCAFATLLSIPYMAIAKRIESQFILKLLIYVLMVGAAFYVYGVFLGALSELVRSGDIKYVFDLKTINSIHDVSEYLYPSKFFAEILLSQNVLINIIAIISVSLLAVLISYFVVKKMYLHVIQEQLEGSSKVYRKKTSTKKHGQMFALIKKEFVVVLRTPTYAFQYFAMAISLPLMVYVCAFLLESMLETLTIIDCNYALAIFTVAMFSILTNTFCTTNISRDGKMFGLLKAQPITIKQIVNAKVIFCALVSLFSVFISSFVLLVTGFLNFTYFLITFIGPYFFF